MKLEFDVEFGWKAKDKITGFVGIITGIVMYSSGCSQVLLVPTVDKDGKKRESEYFDIQRIERIDDSETELDNEETPGFDMEAPKR